MCSAPDLKLSWGLVLERHDFYACCAIYPAHFFVSGEFGKQSGDWVAH
jgi:hypothetical protein